MRKIELKKKVFKFEDEIDVIMEKKVTRFGTGAKYDEAQMEILRT